MLTLQTYLYKNIYNNSFTLVSTVIIRSQALWSIVADQSKQTVLTFLHFSSIFVELSYLYHLFYHFVRLIKPTKKYEKGQNKSQG